MPRVFITLYECLVSIKDIEEDTLHDYKQIIDQMIFYGGQGAFFDGSVKLHTYDGNTFVVKAEFINDFDNDDFNNTYYDVVVMDAQVKQSNVKIAYKKYIG